ncbi:MAG: TIR domain-containing protein [Lachnospiraceae bacterium]|nr:TIR domain-containing protein [Lachnospiraceae bacterium]
MEHYNAFISYKHAPLDNKVAEAVHKGLERFHIPAKIRKKTWIKRINRIFRDKDELPITSDLTDTIANALAGSDYLIVICSPNTKESAWVPREIEYFLKNHSKKQIFTVLAGGEPIDVIPKILTSDEREVTDEAGNKQIVTIPVEPLSCDYRIPAGKAKRTELPRLASGIIGCGYDELMNRHRQYVIKQMTAVFALALAIMAAFCGYMYYSKKEIHKNYLTSLENQSRYLANEAEYLLEKEQRITALQLALEALPKGPEDDRPVTAEAVKAITDATLAYESSNGNNIHAVWNYTMPDVITDFKISPGGKKIAIMDESSAAGVWDTKSHKRDLYLERTIPDLMGIQFAGDDTLLLWNEKALYGYDIQTEEQIWEYTLDDDSFCDDRNFCRRKDSFYIVTYKGEILDLDPKTGTVKEALTLPLNDGDEQISVTEIYLSPNEKKMAFRGMGGWSQYTYGVYDLTNKQIVMAPVTEDAVKNICWLDDERIAVATTTVDHSGSMSYGTRQLISTDTSVICCVSASDLSEQWKSDFTCNGIMVKSGFVPLENLVAYFSGNVVTVYEADTGKVKYSNNVNDSVVDVSDKDGDGNPLYITENGGYAMPALSVDTDGVYYNRYFADEIRQTVIAKGVYVRQKLSHEIIYYGVNVYDEDWTALNEDPYPSEGVRSFYLDAEHLVAIAEEESGAKMHLFSMTDQEHRAKDLEGDKAYHFRLLGSFEGKVYAAYDDEGTFRLITYDPALDELKNEDLFEQVSLFENSCVLKDGKLLYIDKTEEHACRLVVMDLAGGQKDEVLLPEDIGYITNAPAYYEQEECVYLSGDSEYVVDLKSGSVEKMQLPEEWNGCLSFSDSSDGGLFAVSDGKQILLADANGSFQTSISCPGVEPIGMTFVDGQLAVLYHNGGLCRYNKDTGELLGKIEISAIYDYSGDVTFQYDSENGLLYIQMEKLTDVVDMKSGVQTACITNCFGYLKGRDIFITLSDHTGVKQVGYYRRYTIEELVDKAHTILNNAELSDETKTRYGIGS